MTLASRGCRWRANLPNSGRSWWSSAIAETIPTPAMTLSGPRCAPGGSTVRVHLMATPSVADATWTLAGDRARTVAASGCARPRNSRSTIRRCRRSGGVDQSRAEPRLTRDVDVALSVVDDADADADAEYVINALRGRGYEVLAIVEQEAAGRLSTVRLIRRGDEAGLVTDLLFASSGVEPEIVEAADDVEVLPGLELPVATIGHLIVMKLLARNDRRRPNDADELRALATEAMPADWEQAL